MDTETDRTASPTAEGPPPVEGPSAVDWARALFAERTAGLPAWVVLIELFIGLGWLRAATEKLIDPGWWQGRALASFLTEHESASLIWYRPFLDLAVEPHLVVTAAIVVGAQLAAGASLITGRHRTVGLGIGVLLNLNFLAAGAVNPSAFYLLSQGAVLLWLAEETRWRGVVRGLFAVRATALVLAAGSVPFVRTLEPEAVIDDPAAMFVCGGLLVVVAVDVALRNRAPRSGLAQEAESVR